MKIKCIKYLSPRPEQIELDSSPWLTKGKEYIVLGLSIRSEEFSIYIESDKHAGYFDIKGFEVISNYIPSSWIIRYKPSFHYMAFYPKLWIEANNFWVRFVNDDSEMVELYHRERDLIYKEEREYEFRDRPKK